MADTRSINVKLYLDAFRDAGFKGEADKLSGLMKKNEIEPFGQWSFYTETKGDGKIALDYGSSNKTLIFSDNGLVVNKITDSDGLEQEVRTQFSGKFMRLFIAGMFGKGELGGTITADEKILLGGIEAMGKCFIDEDLEGCSSDAAKKAGEKIAQTRNEGSQSAGHAARVERPVLSYQQKCSEITSEIYRINFWAAQTYEKNGRPWFTSINPSMTKPYVERMEKLQGFGDMRFKYDKLCEIMRELLDTVTAAQYAKVNNAQVKLDQSVTGSVILYCPQNTANVCESGYKSRSNNAIVSVFTYIDI